MRDRKRKRNGQKEIQKERWPWRHKQTERQVITGIDRYLDQNKPLIMNLNASLFLTLGRQEQTREYRHRGRRADR